MQRQPPQQETIDNIVELKLAVMRLNWFKRLFIARNLLQALGEFQVTDPKAAHAASQVQKVHHAYYRSTGLINWIGKIFLSCMIQFGQKIEQCHINREGTPVYSQTPPLTDPIEDRHITFDGSPLPNSPIRQTQSHDELTRLVYSPPSAAPEAELSYAQNHREMVLHRPTPRLLDPLRKPQPVLWPFFYRSSNTPVQVYTWLNRFSLFRALTQYTVPQNHQPALHRKRLTDQKKSKPSPLQDIPKSS